VFPVASVSIVVQTVLESRTVPAVAGAARAVVGMESLLVGMVSTGAAAVSPAVALPLTMATVASPLAGAAPLTVSEDIIPTACHLKLICITYNISPAM
jgi:hypothetical protein